MMKRFLLIACVMLLFCCRVGAQVKVTAELDNDSITTEDEAYITVTVTGASSTSDPVIPKVSGLSIVQTGHSSSFQIINGNMSSSSQFSFTVVPEDAATFVIAPFSVFAGGVEYKSNSLTLTVQKNSGFYSKPAPSAPFPNLPNQNGQQGSSQPSDKSGNPFLISTTVSNTNPKVHEQVLFHFKLAAKQTANIVDMGLPEFTDFLAVEVVPEKQGQEVINGDNYSTYETVYALFPLKPGKITIGETKLKLRYFVNSSARSQLFGQFSNDPFFNQGAEPKTKILTAPAIELNVAELPQPIPNDFTHLVGNFGVTTELSGQKVTVGDSVTYTIKISGRGNVSDATLPEIVIPNAKIYQDKPNAETQNSATGIVGSKTFKLAIVPTQAGTLTIPQLTVSYFDPAKNSYEKLNLEAQTIQVIPSQNETTNAVLPPAPNATVPAVLPLDNTAMKSALTQIRLHLPKILYGVLILILVLLLQSVILRWFKSGEEKRHGQSQRKKSLQRALKILDNTRATEDEVFNAIRAYFRTVSAAGNITLTAVEIAKIARAHGVADPLVARLATILERFEAAQYGFEKPSLSQEVRVELKAILKAVQAVIPAKAGISLL